MQSKDENSTAIPNTDEPPSDSRQEQSARADSAVTVAPDQQPDPSEQPEQDDVDDTTAQEMQSAMGFAAFGAPAQKKRKYDRLDAVVATDSLGAAAPLPMHARAAGRGAPLSQTHRLPPKPVNVATGSNAEPLSRPQPRAPDRGVVAETSYFKPSFIEDPWAPLLAERARRAGAGAGVGGG